MGLPEDIIDDWVLDSIIRYDRSLLGNPNNGTRKVSGQLLSPPDSDASMHSTESSGSVAAASSVHPDVTIPINLHSIQALEFVGFDKNTSTWLCDNLGSERSFETVVMEYVEENCIYDEPEDWYASMKKLGISTERQEGIMDPAFEDVRSTGTLFYWLREIFQENIWSLQNMSKRLEQNLEIIKAGGPSTPLRGGASQDRTRYLLTQTGHTTLYRATSAARLTKVFDSGTLCLEEMCRKIAPSDFCWELPAYYWSKEFWVAERFAAYTSRNCSQAQVCIIRVLCPQGLLQGEHVWKLEYSDDWRKLIWYSRRGKPYPADIKEKWHSSKLITGPVSINSNMDIVRLKSWEDVQRKHMYVVGGEEASQYVWIGGEAMMEMNEHWKDKFDIFKCSWSQVLDDKWVDCKAKHIADPEKWVK